MSTPLYLPFLLKLRAQHLSYGLTLDYQLWLYSTLKTKEEVLAIFEQHSRGMKRALAVESRQSQLFAGPPCRFMVVYLTRVRGSFDGVFLFAKVFLDALDSEQLWHPVMIEAAQPHNTVGMEVLCE